MTGRRHDLNTTFEDFVRAHGQRLLRTAVLLAGGEQAGEDLLQDALERALRSWPRRDIEFPAAYVRTIMVHQVRRDRVRGRVRTVPLKGQETAGRDEIGRADARAALLEALAQLPSKQRAAVVLRHWEGHTEAETAQILGCSLGTVKSQTHHALRVLREQCGPSFPGRGSLPRQAGEQAVKNPVEQPVLGGTR